MNGAGVLGAQTHLCHFLSMGPSTITHVPTEYGFARLPRCHGWLSFYTVNRLGLMEALRIPGCTPEYWLGEGYVVQSGLVRRGFPNGSVRFIQSWKCQVRDLGSLLRESVRESSAWGSRRVG